MTAVAEKMIIQYDTVLDKKRARYYVKTMKRMTNDSAHALKEFHRIERVLRDPSSLKKSSKRWLDNRRNILASFTFAAEVPVSVNDTVTNNSVSSANGLEEVDINVTNNDSPISHVNNINVKE